MTTRAIKKILVANRSEIAIRVMRAANELGIRTVAIYAGEDRFSLHRFKADESYRVGEGKKPVDAYLDIPDILRIARDAGVDAIHPGYGFLSENPEFAEACAKAGIAFIGPQPDVMRRLGNKVAARELAAQANVPTVPATGPLPRETDQILAQAAGVGYPLMVKASWGGGGRGMRVVDTENDLLVNVDAARREAGAAFGNDEVYLEKLVRRARHVEVQILGDTLGTLVHLGERDCSVQRRHQKVVEQAPAPYLSAEQREQLCSYALAIGRKVNYTHAGTVEFLMDADTSAIYFIEVNPRIQVEHTVTEEVTGIDIVKAQIRITEGKKIGLVEGEGSTGVPTQDQIQLRGYALQCRITTEDPENGFRPDYGRLTAYRSPAGFGIRLDGGSAYGGAVITPYYDSLLVKVTARAGTRAEAIRRMDRALREFRIRGLSTNLQFLENVINHPSFIDGSCTTRFIDNTPELLRSTPRKDRATKLLRFIGQTVVHSSPEMKGRHVTAKPHDAHVPDTAILQRPIVPGTRDKLRELGPEKFAQWMRNEKRALLTDTTLRDAHQSLFATRMRSHDMLRIAPYYARLAPQLFSLECWGGATFDVAMRFLKEDPWVRLQQLRAAVPNVLLQMLLRGSNAVGYTNYPDNVVKYFVQQAAKNGIDLFRVFDSLNWVENMRVSIDAVRETGALCEGAICYTGDLFDKGRPKFNLAYYIKLAKELEKSGVHILGIKDMAGVCRPRAARELVTALKNETGLPIHFHTHDTSGIAAASVLAALEAGCDAVDGALDSMSGLTSQPNLSSIAAALDNSDRETGIEQGNLQILSNYFEGVRKIYAPFEPDIRSGTADVYRHEMPGGQYTNLREQARALGLEARWPEVAKAYAEVNQLFGDIVKVTPTSKVVGDMALFMVGNGLTPADVNDPNKDINFPESVVSLFKGELGYPPDGFPVELQKKVLRGAPAIPGRAAASMPAADLNAERAKAKQLCEHDISDSDLASYLMYPKVFADFAKHRNDFGQVDVLPTPTFFYGLSDGEEIVVDIEPGKSLIIRLLGRSEVDADGYYKLFFELNGQGRQIRVPAKAESVKQRKKAEEGNASHVGAPMPGRIALLNVKTGQKVKRGDPLLALEAMKMETILRADMDGTVGEIEVKVGQDVEARDLLLVIAL